MKSSLIIFGLLCLFISALGQSDQSPGPSHQEPTANPAEFENLVPDRFDPAEDRAITEYHLEQEPYEMRELMKTLFEPGRHICEERFEIRKQLKEFYFKSFWAYRNYDQLKILIEATSTFNTAPESNADYEIFMTILSKMESEGTVSHPVEVNKWIAKSYTNFLNFIHGMYKTKARSILQIFEARRLEINQIMLKRIAVLKTRGHMTLECQDFLRNIPPLIKDLDKILNRSYQFTISEWIRLYHDFMPKYVTDTLQFLSAEMPPKEFKAFKQAYQAQRAKIVHIRLPANVIRSFVGVYDDTN